MAANTEAGRYIFRAEITIISNQSEIQSGELSTCVQIKIGFQTSDLSDLIGNSGDLPNRPENIKSLAKLSPPSGQLREPATP
jgi:hypothetical protein